jgi:hypothetical protein
MEAKRNEARRGTEPETRPADAESGGKNGGGAPGRKRTVQIKFRVTPEERDLIYARMKAAFGTRNMAAYMRKMAIDGYAVSVDYSHLKEFTAAIGKVGANVNQIARRANAGGGVTEKDRAEVKEALAEIWRTQRSILSKAL